MSVNVSSAQGIPATQETLDSDEQTIFDRIFQRNYVFQNYLGEWSPILMRHKDEIQAAAAIAKAQFGVTFGGLQPGGSQFGMSLIRAPFFALQYWDLTAAAYAAVSGSTLAPATKPAAGVNTWLDGRVISSSAAAGTALVVGRFAVHAMVGIGDASQNPVIESFQENLNGNLQPVLEAEQQYRVSQMHFLEFDAADIYKLNTTFSWQYNSDYAQSTESPFFFGVSFLPFTQIKYLNPNSFNGGTATDSVIHI
jgi:hypothetical protein